MRGGKIDRSLLKGESFELFSAAIRSPATREGSGYMRQKCKISVLLFAAYTAAGIVGAIALAGLIIQTNWNPIV